MQISNLFDSFWKILNRFICAVNINFSPYFNNKRKRDIILTSCQLN